MDSAAFAAGAPAMRWRSALFLVTGRATVVVIASALAEGRPQHWIADVTPAERAGMWRVFADDSALP